MNDLAQIMKDLSVLVIDQVWTYNTFSYSPSAASARVFGVLNLCLIQGTIVDRIDHNIQNVASTVEDGLKQLKKVSLCFLHCHSNSQKFPSLQSSVIWFIVFFFVKAVISFNVMLGLIELQAERSQKRGGMVMCATVLVIMCFIMLVLLILKEIIFWFLKVLSINFA